MQRTPRIFFILIIIILSAYFPLLAQVSPEEIELSGRKVKMELVKTEDLSLGNLSDITITLESESVITKPNDNIFKLLKTNGIYPDSDAFALVYDLNPSLTKLDPLDSGTTLTLPKIKGNDKLYQALKNGYSVMLTLDAELKLQLNNLIDDIKKILKNFSYSSIKNKHIVRSIKESSEWFEYINKTIARRTARPIRKVTLIQILYEAESFRNILRQFKNSAKMNVNNERQTLAINEDLGEWVKLWDQTMAGAVMPAESQFNVVVNIYGKAGDDTKSLRIYYVVRGNFREPPVRSSSFNGLGSGSSAVLPIKNYKIWAARDGDPGNPLTPVKDLEVRQPSSGNTIVVELSLK